MEISGIYLVIIFISGATFAELLRIFGPTLLELFLKKRKEKSLAHGDIRASIQIFCDSWEDYKGRELKGYDFREDLRVSLQGIREQARAYEQLLDSNAVTKIRNLSRDFFALLEKKPEMDDKTWTTSIENDGNKICREFRSLVKKCFD